MGAGAGSSTSPPWSPADATKVGPRLTKVVVAAGVQPGLRRISADPADPYRQPCGDHEVLERVRAIGEHRANEIANHITFVVCFRELRFCMVAMRLDAGPRQKAAYAKRDQQNKNQQRSHRLFFPVRGLAAFLAPELFEPDFFSKGGGVSPASYAFSHFFGALARHCRVRYPRSVFASSCFRRAST